MPGQEQQQNWLSSYKDNFNILLLFVNAYACAFLPILRTDIGPNGLGVPALVAMVGILWYAAQTGSQQMLSYFWAWLAMVVWRRLTPGKGVHSYYQGRAYLTLWLVGDEMLARLVEAVLVWIAGNCLYGWSEAVARFVTCGGVALAVKVWIEWAIMSRQEEALADAVIEMKVRTQRANRRR